MSTFSFTSTPISEILIYWEDTPYLYTAQGLVQKDVYFHNRFKGNYAEWVDLLESHYNQVTIRIADSAVPAPQQIPNTNTVSSGIYLLQSIRTDNQTYKGTLCIALKETFVRSIFQDQQFAKGRQIFVLDSDTNIVAANTDAELSDILYGLNLKDIHNTSLYLPQRGLISNREATISELEYVIFTPYDQMVGAFDRVFWTANIFSAVTVFVLLCYAFWSSRQMYKPFRGILNALGQTPRNVETKDDVLYITTRVLDLLSVNQTMHTMLQSNSHMVLQSVLYKLIMGGPSVEETLASVTPYNISLSDGIYETAIIRMDLPHDEEERFYTEYHDVFDRNLHAYLDAWIVEALQTLPDEYTLVLCLKDYTEQAHLIKAMHEMYESWRRQIPGSSFFIGVSDCIRNILELRVCYEKSVAALFSRPVQSKDAIVLVQTDSAAKGIPYLPDDLEAQLRSLLEKPTDEPLLAYVDGILDRNYRKNVAYKAYLSACVTISRFVGRLVQSKNESISADLIQISPSNYVYTAERCREIVLSNLSVASKLLAQTNVSASIGEQITSYVNEHFHEDINLASVANELGYTPNYISRYYKQANGINFTDYLNSRRVAFACELLASTSKNLNRIAEMSGFRSSNFFIKVFKKYEGVTPGEYRRRMRLKTETADDN